MLPWRYIVVEGVIGVGKTSLVKLLATRAGARVNLEVVEENPFLGRFYQNRAAHAFQTQIFFLLSRFRQQQQLTQPELFQRSADQRLPVRQGPHLRQPEPERRRAGAVRPAGLDPRGSHPQARPGGLPAGQHRAAFSSASVSGAARSSGGWTSTTSRASTAPTTSSSTTTRRRRCWWWGPTRLDYVGVPSDLELLIDQLREPFTGTRYFAPAGGGPEASDRREPGDGRERDPRYVSPRRSATPGRWSWSPPTTCPRRARPPPAASMPCWSAIRSGRSFWATRRR